MRQHCEIVFLGLWLCSVMFTPAYAFEYTRFDVVGDSISDGVNPDYYPAHMYGWVQMLFGEGGAPLPDPKTNTIYTLWPGIVASNSAVSGSRAWQWATNSYPYLDGVLDNHPDLVVVFIGGNDLFDAIQDGALTEQEKARYRTNLITIVTALQSNTPSPTIVMVDYYDLADGLSANFPLYPEYTSASPATIEFDSIIRDVAQEHLCYHVSIYSNFMNHCYGFYLGGAGQHLDPFYVITNYVPMIDIHPNTPGHSEIYDQMYAELSFLKAVPEPLSALPWIIGFSWCGRRRMCQAIVASADWPRVS